jgi:uncharacterized damage-inducible protein DinB
MKYIVKEDLDITFKELNETMDKFDQLSFNKEPESGGWTAGQVAEHIIKSNVVSLLSGNLKESERNEDEKVEQLAEIFLDFDAKYPNPEFNNPSDGEHDLKTSKEELNKIHKDALEAAESKDLTKICLDFELPESGLMTGKEWLYFLIYHYQRHTHQMKNILSEI